MFASTQVRLRSIRVLEVFRPSHRHGAASATFLLAGAVLLARVLGAVRDAYIAWAFGAGATTDAFVAAFTVPDLVGYLLAGSTASITLVSLLSKYAASNREEEADKAFGVIITFVTIAVTFLVLLAMVFAEPIMRTICPQFTEQQISLSVELTRILMPIPAFLMVGGIVSGTLQWRHRFLFPALTPVVYNLGTIVGGVCLSPWYGIASLAYGALAGALVGAFLLNLIGARWAGVRFTPSFDLRNEGFLEWMRLTFPLMIGASLVFFDEPFMRYFLSGGTGDITRISYAKRMFAVPTVIIGQAAGQAYLPSFARLFSSGQMQGFADAVNRTVYRAASLGLLAASWLMCVSLPCVDLLFRAVRGRFQFHDSQQTATLLIVFSFSTVFWAVQGFYARAFYAAGNTLIPMIVGTTITVLSFPLYWLAYDRLGIIGLPIASGLGMMAQTITLALTLNHRGLVALPLRHSREIGKALVVAIAAGAVGRMLSSVVPLHGSRADDLHNLLLTTAGWGITALVVLLITRSSLLAETKALFRRATQGPGTT